jgi:hypothetical protein
MFGRRSRKTPFEREPDERLEMVRDDCVALFLNSRMTMKQLHERGGPTPQTISKWLYRETLFPRYQTIDQVANALGYHLAIVPRDNPAAKGPRATRLGTGLRINKVTMPTKRGATKTGR